ncbi:hypothetical protein D2T29_00400 [Sinirhodobacter populi]|uniref:Uncharacterized protein n=1 Tax=Paenirhodobacter populi TaxID=2306993 RepID=A0A443KPS8_9RHOB|nr:hypothetical protein [Sinirhodobacter populi]RWR34971.1 hypothetical protein D2T29_00400 [Sinirhodobacter populi]
MSALHRYVREKMGLAEIYLDDGAPVSAAHNLRAAADAAIAYWIERQIALGIDPEEILQQLVDQFKFRRMRKIGDERPYARLFGLGVSATCTADSRGLLRNWLAAFGRRMR